MRNPYALAAMNPLAMGGLYNPYAGAMLGTSMLGGASFFGGLGLGGLF
jgi:hypothetical protein